MYHMNWLNAVKMVKCKIAEKDPSYSQEGYMNITFKGTTKSVRKDCSGYVSACLYFYGAFPKSFTATSWAFSKDSKTEKYLKKAGFKKMKFPGWSKLKEGDIISQANSHVEIFSHNLSGAHYVFSNGKTSDMRSYIPTKDSGTHKYDTVWRLEAEPVDKYSEADFIKDLEATFELKVNGKPNKKILEKTITISENKNNKHYLVRCLQKNFKRLGYISIGAVDGIAGSKFTKTVKKYQKKVLKYADPDGILTAGGKTWKSLIGL